MNWMKNLGAAMAVALAVGWGGMAQANLITTANTTSFTIFESCTTGTGATCPGGNTNVNSTLSATAVFGNFVWSNNNTTLSFQIALSNTTPQGTQTTAQWQADRLTAFGFNTNPDATSVTGSDSAGQFNTFTETNFPSFNTVDICEGSGTNCEGGGNGGLAPLGSGAALPGNDLINLTLNGLNGIIGIDFGTEGAPGSPENDYFFKFQTSFGSFEPRGSSVCLPGAPNCVVNPPVDVPEPGSLALFGTALVAFGGMAMFWRRRKQNGSALPTGLTA